MSVRNYIINSIWIASAKSEYRRFVDQIKHARPIQDNYLLDLLRRNSQTEFGKDHNFENIKSISVYRDSVPVRTYDDFKPWIERIIKGEKKVLTEEKVTLLEPTGGSSGGTKLIPYTKSLRNEFLKGINAWVFDLNNAYPSLRHGSSYWSISPHTESLESIESAVPVGFDDDTNYLGWTGNLLKRVMVGDPVFKKITDIDEFRFKTSLALLSVSDLTFISFWNPTYLTILTDYINSNSEKLVRALALTNKSRASEIDRLLRRQPDTMFTDLWPRLKVISCWTDSSASIYAEKLSAQFPGVDIQGKGLLATEGFVSFPFSKSGGNVLAYDSHFYEFVDKAGNTFSCDELKVDDEYRILLTTGGGLYRYDIGDLVRVTGNYNGLPMLKFIGRDKTIDLVGEKLTESHVSLVLVDLTDAIKSQIEFAMLAPDKNDNGQRYTLYLQTSQNMNGELETIKERINAGLQENIYYSQAIDLGQLENLKVYVIENNAAERYQARCESDGQKIGDIKPSCLDPRDNWSNWFDGSFID